MSRKLAFILCVLLGTINLTGFSQAALYKTSADYGSENVSTYTHVTIEKNIITATDKEGKQVTIDLNTEKVWGFRDEWGADFRLSKANVPMRIVEYGAISIYIRKERLSTTAPDELTPVRMAKPYLLNKDYSFSITPDGEMKTYTRGKFLKALKSDRPTYDKFKAYMKENHEELLAKIIEHNTEKAGK